MKIIFIVFFFIFLNSCAAINIANIAKDELNGSSPDNISSLLVEPPYEMNGKWFYPKNHKSFTQVGLASKISGLEVGSKTFNGERYHPEILSGAHASLALPSLVSVTNLDNGYTVNVRINHRGGYSNINIIEFSPAVFDMLDIVNNVELVEINLINQNESFVLKEAKTFNVEKKVKNAPVSIVSIESIEVSEDISINDNVTQTLDKIREVLIKDVKKGKIYLNITKFSFKRSAVSFKDGFNSNLNIDIIETIEGNRRYYNVVLGPFDDIESLNKVQKNDIFSLYEDISLLIL